MNTIVRTLLLLTCIIVGGNFISYVQHIADNMPDYMILITVLGFLCIAWVQVIKLVKGN